MKEEPHPHEDVARTAVWMDPFSPVLRRAPRRRAGRRSPTIAVTGPDHRGWLLWAFTGLAVRRAHGRPLAVTPSRPPDDLRRIDGAVIVGGADVDPALYGQPNVAARKIDPPRDRMEIDLIHWAIQNHKPLLGICRGAQLLNVALGGTLHQEAADVYPGFRPTAGLYQQLTRRRPIRVIRAGWTAALLDPEREHPVNSLHHQAIADVAAPLEVVAVDEHGMTQAVELRDKGRFAVGVQWHPELMPHSLAQRRFFASLVRAAVRAGREPPPGAAAPGTRLTPASGAPTSCSFTLH